MAKEKKDPFAFTTTTTVVPAKPPDPGHGEVKANIVMLRNIQIQQPGPNEKRRVRADFGKYGVDETGVKVLDPTFGKFFKLEDFGAELDMDSEAAQKAAVDVLELIGELDPKVQLGIAVQLLSKGLLALAVREQVLDAPST